MVTVLLEALSPPTLRPVVNIVEFVTIIWLATAPLVPPPTVTKPALVIVAPVMLKMLLAEEVVRTLVAMPTVTLLPSMFHVTLLRTLTVLLDEPLPTIRPAVQTVALVTDIELTPPAAPPMVTIPLLEKILPIDPPLMTNEFRVALVPTPTETGPLP